MGSRTENLHKVLLEAKVREHPSDVDLRGAIIGFGIFALVIGLLILDILSRLGYEVESDIGVLLFCIPIAFVVILYVISKFCRAYPVGARWAIFYSSFVFSIAYMALVLFFAYDILPLGIDICVYLLIVSYISVRKIYKYHREERE